MGAFTSNELVCIRFISRIDKKGRVLIPAPIRKRLGIKYGSVIFVVSGKEKFFARVDERGRFYIPLKTRRGFDNLAVSLEFCIKVQKTCNSSLQLSKGILRY